MKYLRAITVILSALLLWGCASTVELGGVERPLMAGRFEEAATALDEHGAQVQHAQGELVLTLDQGMVRHYARDFESSNKSLTEAERLISDAFTKSITEDVGSYIVNDNVKTYPGEDFEDIYSNVFKSLNYQALGKTEDAMVEIRRATEKQQVLRNKYEKLFAKTSRSARDNDVAAISQNDVVSIEFSHSALADYLGMLYCRQLGAEADKGYFYRQVSSAFASQPKLYPFPVPKSLDTELAVPTGMARINILAFSGLEPEKKEESTYLPISNTPAMKIALPVMMRRGTLVSRVDVTIGDEHFSLEPIEDLSAVAINTFELRAQDIANKTIVRATMKALGTSIVDGVAHHAAKNSSDADKPGMEFLADMLTLFSNVFSVASERADLRMSHFFPSIARVGGVNVSPGTYDVTVQFKDSSGFVVGRVVFKDYVVRSGKLNLCEAVCLR
jgi:hypothetical protein